MPEHIATTLKWQIVEVLDKPNKNGRIYTTELVKDKILNDPLVKEQLDTHQMFGMFMPNYDEDLVNPIKVSHCITNLYIENCNLIADLDILDFGEGLVVKSLIDKGVKIRPVLRGNGDLVADENGNLVVTNYTFNRIDLTVF